MINIFANMTWFDFVLGVIIPVLVAAAIVAFLIVQIVKAPVQYARSGNVRERREKRIEARNMGAVLKAHRVRCGMTPESVAAAVGVSRKAVSRWEKGACVLGTANLLPLADLYGVTVEELQEACR